MKLSATLLFAIALAACSPQSEEQTREQARTTAEKVKVDSRKALHVAEADTRKASRELNEDLEKARDKTRRVLNTDAPPPPDRNGR